MTDEAKGPPEGERPEDGASTEERLAFERERARPPTDEYFDGIPPEQLAREEDGVPELEPEFADALREAGGKAPRPAPPPPPPEPEPEPSEPPLGEDPGEAVEGAAGDSPEAEPVPAGPEPAAVAAAASPPPPAPSPPPVPDSDPPPVPPPAPAPDPFLDQTTIMKVGRDEARAAVAGAAETGRPWAPTPPPPSGDPEPAPRRKRLWLRFLAAAFVVVASFASATTAVGVLRLNNIIEDLKPVKLPPNALVTVKGGDPETFLILGSDRRAAQVAAGERGLSDTTILLRVDPDQKRISILNIPRDLKTYIPGVGIDKFNAAYAYGGPKLTLRTIKRLTAHTGLHINHLVNVDFLGFAQAVNAINCVYVDVDRRYYHSNAGLPPSEQYAEINIQPGYQRLCGADGLAYVRYRHTDTDLVRAARQQDFLREARQRVPPSELLQEVTGTDDRLIKIFTSHTQSDIQDISTMIDVLKLMIEARNAPIKEVHFPATIGYSYVYATRSEIAGAIHQFIAGEASGGPRGSLEDGATKSTQNQEKKQKKGKGKGAEKKARKHASPAPTPKSDGLVDASSSGLAEAKKAARKASPALPIYYPTRVPPGSQYDDNEELSSNPRVYHVKDTSGNVHEAYKTVLSLSAPDGSHYFGVQGIRGWSDPPALDDPSESLRIGKLDCDIFLDGDRIRSISWHDGENSYWLSNSLLQTLTNDEMLGMVRSMRSITPNEKRHPKPKRKK